MKFNLPFSPVDVSCGPTQMGIVDQSNDLYMMGKQLSQIWSLPTKVMSDVETVSCGKDYTLVLSKIGHVYAFGLNTMQQMTGLKQNAYSHPKRIKHSETIVQLCASTSNKTHGMILSVD